jgi:hypothetical protein
MLTTIEAEIDVNGSVTFLEPLKISKKVGRLLRSLKYAILSPKKLFEKLILE